MVKRILFACDEAFFNKMKKDKFVKESKLGYALTWEDYIKLIFGFSKLIRI